MTKNEAARQTHQQNALMSLGFTQEESDKLRRISMMLRRWHEKECGVTGGCIERDEVTGRAMWRTDTGRLFPAYDMETGALKRLAAIIDLRNARIDNPRSKNAEQYIHATCRAMLAGKVGSYIQTDPRGAALYIIRPDDIPEGQSVDSCYSRGICVY